MLDGSLIFRRTLVDLFERMSNERILYVCAPAGFGKSVAARQWFDTRECEKAAITMDEYDNHPELFCRRFCTALSACQPHNTALKDITSHPALAGAPDEFALRAVAALSSSEQAVFIIDDLQNIYSETVLNLLMIALQRFPENFHIVIISRSDLPPGFSDLWIKGSLTRVTAEQLRFDREEIMRLYAKRGQALTLKQAEEVYQMTGGWAIGINALLLSGGLPSGESLEYLENFIRSNVWNKWDEETRDFLLNTSLARELHPALCTELSGVADSERCLRELMRRGAFVLQTGDGVYQYHQLFREFLNNMLSEYGEAYRQKLLETEGAWYLGRKNFFSAADCFLRSRNPEKLGDTIDLLAITSRENFIIERLLPILQTPVFHTAAQKRPFLFTYMAWAALAAGKAKELESYADQYYARFPEVIVQDPHRANNLFLMYFVDYRVSLHELIKAARGWSSAGHPNTSPGSVSLNMPFIHRCPRDFSEIAREDMDVGVSRLKKMIGWIFGEEADLLENCLKAGLYYEQGSLEKAHMYVMEANAAIRENFAPELKFCAICTLVCILDAQDRAEEAEHALERAAAMIEQGRAYYLNQNYLAMLCRRKLENGDMDAARHWIAENSSTLYDALRFYDIYAAYTTCRAYITLGDYDAAIILLKKVYELAKTYRRPLDMIESRSLLAIAYWKKKRGFQGMAMEYLEDAVSQAYGYGYVQVFANEGLELSGMMRRLQGRVEQRGSESTIPASFVKMLYLKTLEHHNSGLTSGQPEPVVRYTDKQKAVMRLLCEGRSYREITELLGIKLPTLRSHIALIYKKLDVTCETDAVFKMNALGMWDGE